MTEPTQAGNRERSPCEFFNGFKAKYPPWFLYDGNLIKNFFTISD